MNAYSAIGRIVSGYECKSCGREFKGFGLHAYVCNRHSYGGGDFCSQCAAKNNYHCPICGKYIG